MREPAAGVGRGEFVLSTEDAETPEAALSTGWTGVDETGAVEPVPLTAGEAVVWLGPAAALDEPAVAGIAVLMLNMRADQRDDGDGIERRQRTKFWSTCGNGIGLAMTT